jgi:integrase
MRRVMREVDTGTLVDPAHITVGEYLKRWLSDAAKQRLAAKSYERASGIIRLHLVPTLGSQPLAKLSPLHLQTLYGQLQADGMAAAGVRKVHAVVHSALSQAVKWRLLSVNPADGVDLPRIERAPIHALSEAETVQLLATAEGSRLYAPVLVALTTGLRRGELLGLRWQDVDLEGGALSVVQSLEETGAGVGVKQPKTAGSRRRVTLPASTIAVLRAHRVAQDEERLRAGSRWHGSGLVFTTAGGQPWRPSAFSMAFKRLIASAGMPPMRFHDLRHTHASQLLRQGVHPKVVQERLGHANIGITMDLYSHVTAGLQDEAARLTDNLFKAAVSKRCPSGEGDV